MFFISTKIDVEIIMLEFVNFSCKNKKNVDAKLD